MVGCRVTYSPVCIFATANAIDLLCINSGAKINPLVGILPINGEDAALILLFFSQTSAF
jgi:hypothetical protein